MKLLTNAASNSKTVKKLDHFKFEGVVMHLAPDKIADWRHTVCPWSSPGCRATCLNFSGRSGIKGEIDPTRLLMHTIHRARILKTLWFLKDPVSFTDQVSAELKSLQTRADKKKLKAIARLNATSDIPWETYEKLYPNKGSCVFSEFPKIQYYDYTKSYKRVLKFLDGKLPSNYYLIFSRSEETTDDQIKNIVNRGGNVAIVFRNDIPTRFAGVKTINGDEHDFRFLDPKGVIVGLKAKGRAKKDTTGFVI